MNYSRGVSGSITGGGGTNTPNANYIVFFRNIIIPKNMTTYTLILDNYEGMFKSLTIWPKTVTGDLEFRLGYRLIDASMKLVTEVLPRFSGLWDLSKENPGYFGEHYLSDDDMIYTDKRDKQTIQLIFEKNKDINVDLEFNIEIQTKILLKEWR